MQILKNIFIVVLLVFPNFGFAQTKDLLFYQTLAAQNNATIKENKNLKQFNLLQKDLQIAQFKKPQISVSADYLLAPYFFNNNQFLSVSQNPEKKSFGYDNAITNGGLYAAQLNANLPLLNGGFLKSYNDLNNIQNQLAQNNIDQTVHDLFKMVSDQYVAAYQLQLQINNQEKIIDLVQNRKKIAEELVKNGLMQNNDYLLLEIQIKQRKYEVQQLRISLSTSFNLLNNSCGVADSSLYQLDIPEFILTQKLDNFKIKQKFELDSNAIAKQQMVVNTKYKPQLVAFGNTGLNAIEVNNIAHKIGISAGLHLSIPLYDGGQKKIVAQQNKILIDNLYQFKNQNQTAINNNFATLNQQIDLTKKSIDMINSQLLDQETLLQIIKNKVVIGQISVTDYLNAIQDYATANQNKIYAQTNLWLLINQFNYTNW